MIQLAHHNKQLKVQLASFLSEIESNISRNAICLDSMDDVLRQYLNIEEMREAGSFFTGQELATRLVSKFSKPITFDSVIVDPTCGAGNLLIECSRQLGVEQGLKDTLTKWGKCLRGYDIHKTFVEATKLRLIIEALSRGVEKDCTLEEALELFHNINVADVMTLKTKDFNEVTHVAMNPPFCSWDSPQERFWKKGKVNAAGVVFEHLVELLTHMCQVSAILPDVLRSGSRYSGWRDFASRNIEGLCEIYGRFSNKADVDVFIFSGYVQIDKERRVEWHKKRGDGAILSDYFNVCTGPLVAYRDPIMGDSYPFIHPKSSPPWGVVKNFTEYRKYSGKVFKPPLVVIRRTSSPSDRYRAIGTVIKGKELLAIENHMMVIQPKDGTVASCNRLIKLLKSSETNAFLNDRIRLRHLTVGVVKHIPIFNWLK